MATTGPRMLEAVVDTWHRRHGAGGGGVVVLPPDAFFPTWDPMQAGTFQSRCAVPGRNVRDPLWRSRRSTCERLRKESFRPTIVPAAYTNHMWTHTWIPGAQKVRMDDVVAID